MPRSHSSRWRLRKRRTKRAERSEAVFCSLAERSEAGSARACSRQTGFGGAVSASEPDEKTVDAEIALEPLAAVEASDEANARFYTKATRIEMALESSRPASFIEHVRIGNSRFERRSKATAMCRPAVRGRRLEVSVALPCVFERCTRTQAVAPLATPSRISSARAKRLSRIGLSRYVWDYLIASLDAMLTKRMMTVAVVSKSKRSTRATRTDRQ